MSDPKNFLNEPTTDNQAFPVFQQETQDGHGHCNNNPGLSKLEYFAAAALKGLLSNPSYIDSNEIEHDLYEEAAKDARFFALKLQANLKQRF